jgi:hypothetical protein
MMHGQKSIKLKRGWCLKHERDKVLRNERNGEAQKELRYIVNNKGIELINFGKIGRNNEM